MIVLHDYMEHTDGGSRLCLELARHLPATLVCGFVRRNHPFLHGPLPPLHTLTPALPLPLLRQWLLALAFARGGRARAALRGQAAADGAIFSGSYAPLAVRHCAPGTRTLLYCHTPPRFLYDQRESFEALAPAPLRPLLRHFCHWLRPRYEEAVGRMHAVAVNSAAVQERVRRYLGGALRGAPSAAPSAASDAGPNAAADAALAGTPGGRAREPRVIYPPCRVEAYRWEPAQGYYLSMVRLDALKRVDITIRAFQRMPRQNLLILSDGPAAPALRRLAAGAPNIRFAGAVPEETRIRLLAQCIATVCTAREEDFGMCAVESLAAGKPVLAARAGGLAEICASPDYSVPLPPDPEPHHVCEAVARCDTPFAAAMRQACRARAEAFSLPRFVQEVRELMEPDNAY